jgi:hypothetical protein
MVRPSGRGHGRGRAYPTVDALAYGPVVAWLRSEELGRWLRALAQPQLTELARLLPELLVAVPGVTRPERLPPSTGAEVSNP